MATITGFTAERMLQIENTTVVDGDVVGDNLILLQRDGTQINAGNVRGPQGIQGIPGTPGAVSAVNDQVGTVYAPRIFATKALLDAWTTAPVGTLAVTIDTNTVWQKDGSGWYVNNTDRIFADAADLIARWTNPPQGAIAQIRDGDSSLYKSAASTWTYNNGVRTFPSVARRDSDWPNAPDGALCFAPPPVQWLRQGGAWKAYGLLWTGYQFLSGMAAAQPGIDVKIPGIPTMPIDVVTSVQINAWGGFAANNVTAQVQAFTNNQSSPAAGSGWAIQGVPSVPLAAGAWGSLGSLVLVYIAGANLNQDTFMRLIFSGLGPNLYYQANVFTTLAAK